jgi:quercetin dioxygenase-like cupin family protein
MSNRKIEFSGISAEVLMGGDCPMTIMALTVQNGAGAPPHISWDERKIFGVTQGQFQFRRGAVDTILGPGDRVEVEPGEVHGFRASGQGSAQLTLVAFPARHDRFFQAMADLAVPHDPTQVQLVCRDFNQEIVGPLEEIACASPESV